MKSSKDLGTSSLEIQEASENNTPEPTQLDIQKEENKYQIETGKLNITLTVLKRMFGVIILAMIIFFLCESIPSCNGERMWKFYELLFDVLYPIGVGIVGYIAGTQSKN